MLNQQLAAQMALDRMPAPPHLPLVRGQAMAAPPYNPSQQSFQQIIAQQQQVRAAAGHRGVGNPPNTAGNLTGIPPVVQDQQQAMPLQAQEGAPTLTPPAWMNTGIPLPFANRQEPGSIAHTPENTQGGANGQMGPEISSSTMQGTAEPITTRTQQPGIASQQARGLPDPPVPSSQPQRIPSQGGATNSPPTVYLLSSPSGPQALLVSPHGSYSTTWPFSIGIPDSQSLANHQAPAFGSQVGTTDQAHLFSVQNAHGADLPQENQQAGQREQQIHQRRPGDRERELLRNILIPFGTNLWLLIRLAGFVYFFTGNTGWHRTILIGLVATIVFVLQTGAFAPLIQSGWEPLRRHIEGILPLAGQNQEHAHDRGAQEAPNHENAHAQPSQGPSPEETANRLLRERMQQDGNVFQQGLRRVERAFALFIASLVPGVGERHIAARDAAEAAARREEERQREELAAREREEAQRESDTNLVEGGEIEDQKTENHGSPEQEQSPQQPLLEI